MGPSVAPVASFSRDRPKSTNVVALPVRWSFVPLVAPYATIQKKISQILESVYHREGDCGMMKTYCSVLLLIVVMNQIPIHLSSV